MSDRGRRIADNLAGVQARIAEAALRSGRDADAVRLVAVTKYADIAHTQALVAAGCRDLGESRPQQMWKKAAALAHTPVRWHLIGHLQRNKVTRTAPLLAMLHSLDSLRLAAAVDAAAAELRRSIPVLIEINISGDAAKHGFSEEDVEAALMKLAAFRHLEIRGLMTMAALEGGRTRARGDFQRLRSLRDRLRLNCPENVTLDDLSMGMSSDFEEAVEEGATIVRVGSALFSGLE